MNCAICKLPTENIVGSVLPQCKCGWQAPQPPVTQRTWVGLTDEERAVIVNVNTYDHHGYDIWCDGTGVALDIEEKLKEKNT